MKQAIKIAIVMVLMSCMTSVTFGQETEVEWVEETTDTKEVEWDIDVDNSVFKEYKKGHYMSEDKKSGMSVVLRDVSYKEMKAFHGTAMGGFDLIEAKEIELNGNPFLFSKVEQNRGGYIYEIVSFIRAYGDDRVVEIGGAYDKEKSDIYFNIIKKAAASAKVNK
ncbi:MAG: hypothetical protein AAFP76_06055 [Bacteroidota bacterium]